MRKHFRFILSEFRQAEGYVHAFQFWDLDV
jgi:hypothetical protein